MAEKIQKAYHAKEHTIFNTRVTATQEAYHQLSPLIEKWENDLQLIHTPTTEKILLADNDNSTLLLTAATFGDYKTVSTLLANVKNHHVLNQKTTSLGFAALSYAAQNGYFDVVKLLIGCQTINADIGDNAGETPLYKATSWGNLEIVKLLVESKDHLIDINHANNQGATPLFIAAQNGNHEIVDYLLKQDSIDPNKGLLNGASPLIVAAQNGNFEVVKALLSHSLTNIDKTNDTGDTALRVATQNNYHEVIQFLLAYKDKQVLDNQPETELNSPSSSFKRFR